ncbi:MAG: helix-turn-helix transcriptional regulator [Propionicimonas sp.]
MSRDESSYLPAIAALEALPAALKAVRLSRGTSLRRAAREIGVSFSTVNRIENGEDCSKDNALAVLRWLANPPAPSHIADVMVLDDATTDQEPTVRIWACDQCGKRAPWGEGWTWYGSLRQIEETGTPDFVLCSSTCRTLHAARTGTNPEVTL